MSLIKSWVGWKVSGASDTELPEIYPMPILIADFLKVDVVGIYTKILTDVAERTQGLSEDQSITLWDSCLKSNATTGLISLLADAMANKNELFLVYEKEVNVVRKATSEEQAKIKADYDASTKSTVGIYVSFTKYLRSDLIKFYSTLEYLTIASIYKSMNLSKAIQIALEDLRKSVGSVDAAAVIAQAKAMAEALKNGKDIMMDGKDAIKTTTPNLEAANASITLLNQKKGWYLGMPASYITGEQTTGMGTTGENDTKAVERGLKNYFESILKPVLDALFGVKVKYKSQDFRQIDQALEAMKTFELVQDKDLLSDENRKLIINGLLDIKDENDGEETE